MLLRIEPKIAVELSVPAVIKIVGRSQDKILWYEGSTSLDQVGAVLGFRG